MGRVEVRADFSGALSAIIVVALIVATTALMLVTLNTKAAAVAGLEQGLMAGPHSEARVTTGAVVAVANPADRR